MVHFTDVSADDHFDVNFKILRDPSRPWGKDNYWRISPDCNYSFKDGIFRRRKKQTKEVKKSINFSIGKIEYRPHHRKTHTRVVRGAQRDRPNLIF